MDEVVEYMLERNVVADLLFFVNNEGNFGKQEQDERYVRYLITRYAAYPNVIWCLTNVWEYTEKLKSYWNNLGRILYNEDPWSSHGDSPRFLSIHQRTCIDWQYEDVDWVSHIIMQYGVRNPMASPEGTPQLSYGDAWGNASILYNRGHHMPMVNDEYGSTWQSLFLVPTGMKLKNTGTSNIWWIFYCQGNSLLENGRR